MRCYRILLRLYPVSFRREYGGEMCAIFARSWREASGPLARAALVRALRVDPIAVIRAE